MSHRFATNDWALILGGSSGFGLATARKLAAKGMSLLLVHRDRPSVARRIEPEFERLRGLGVRVHSINADALDPHRRREIVAGFRELLAPDARLRLLFHSIAFGNLKLLGPQHPIRDPAAAFADEAGLDAKTVEEACRALVDAGYGEAGGLLPHPEYPQAFLEDEDFERTVHAMGTSLAGWTQEVFRAGLFAEDARVLAMTSEGNRIAWRGYAAVSAAKAALEAVVRSIAVELAPHGIRANAIQAGVTDTPALRLIPGSDRLKAQSMARNPLGRLTRPGDVADFVYLMCTPEAAWVNGALLRVDGGEAASSG